MAPIKRTEPTVEDCKAYLVGKYINCTIVVKRKLEAPNLGATPPPTFICYIIPKIATQVSRRIIPDVVVVNRKGEWSETIDPRETFKSVVEVHNITVRKDELVNVVDNLNRKACDMEKKYLYQRDMVRLYRRHLKGIMTSAITADCINWSKWKKTLNKAHKALTGHKVF